VAGALVEAMLNGQGGGQHGKHQYQGAKQKGSMPYPEAIHPIPSLWFWFSAGRSWRKGHKERFYGG